MNLYTVNEPWLYSILWCTGVQSVTSDSSHILRKVPFPIWLMVSTKARKVLGASGGRGHRGRVAMKHSIHTAGGFLQEGLLGFSVLLRFFTLCMPEPCNGKGLKHFLHKPFLQVASLLPMQGLGSLESTTHVLFNPPNFSMFLQWKNKQKKYFPDLLLELQ